ncbi:MAG: 1,4-dihydroxy-2-naphthoate octaprenyltransferase [Flavobacterium sp. BFFFF2]|nr:MAG: 1,4-dihydroxy-2-naphthoate octaprenyltransferase [Flavobacterium sp. BFFFF2]
MKHWIEAARLRTLPLSVSGILVGSMYALSTPTEDILTPTQVFNWRIFALLLTTTLGLQITSNFANDYGDGVKGTDNDDRVGPKRTIQQGLISIAAMKRAIIMSSTLTLLSAICLIYLAFKWNYFVYSMVFLLLGIAAIASAIRYTVGKGAYGYKGYGDIFVFIFFGIVSTFGSYFMFAKEFNLWLLLPATAIGFLSVGVLNLNNLRDEASDRKAGKNTLVVQFGGAWGKKYHYFLVVSAMVLLLFFAAVNRFHLDQYLFVVAFFPMIAHLLTVYKNRQPERLDPELKKLAISTFLVSILLAMSLIFLVSDVVVNYL